MCTREKIKGVKKVKKKFIEENLTTLRNFLGTLNVSNAPQNFFMSSN